MTEKLSVDERFRNIEHNLCFINEQIALSAQKSGRTREDIRLMAVTKTVEPIFINHAIECGVDLIGENKVQEFLSKLYKYSCSNIRSTSLCSCRRL